MAHESLNKFVDIVAEMYDEDGRSWFDTLNVLTTFYDTVLKGSKYSSQRAYCKATIERLNSGYAKGYFNTKRK